MIRWILFLQAKFSFFYSFQHEDTSASILDIYKLSDKCLNYFFLITFFYLLNRSTLQGLRLQVLGNLTE